MSDWPKYWEEVCKQCSHSYTTKTEPNKLKCRCRKRCHFDDVNLKEKKS